MINKYGGHQDQLSKRYTAMDFWRIKSMISILNSNLKISDQLETKKILLKKATILLNGYKKHHNLKNYNLVQNWINKISVS